MLGSAVIDEKPLAERDARGDGVSHCEVDTLPVDDGVRTADVDADAQQLDDSEAKAEALDAFVAAGDHVADAVGKDGNAV